MNNFELYNPTRIVFGEGKIVELNRLIPKEAKFLDKIGPEYGSITQRVIQLSDYARLNITDSPLDQEILSAAFLRIMDDFESLSQPPASGSFREAVSIHRILRNMIGQLYQL